MRGARRKQTAEVFELELSLLKLDCPNLGAYTHSQHEPYPQSVLCSFVDNLKYQGNRRVKNLGNGPNAHLRGFCFFCLKSIYDQNNSDLLQKLKQQLYPTQRNLTAIMSLPDNIMELNSNQLKKLMVEFMHVLAYSSEKNKVETNLTRHPLIQMVMLLLFRAILRENEVEMADQFDKAVDWVASFMTLGQIFGVDLKFVNRMRVCEFINRQFYIVCQNDFYFMVYFQQIKTQHIDINDLEFESVSVSMPSDRENIDKSDGSTPKFKMYIDKQKMKRRSHKSSFGGEVDLKASKQISSSTILRKDSAFGEVIIKHKLASEVVEMAQSQVQQDKRPLKLLEEELRKSMSKKKSKELVERNSSGPRFIENTEPLNMEVEEKKEEFKEEAKEEAKPVAPQGNVFKWDERSSFSQLAGLKINQKIKQELKKTENAPIQPGSPTATVQSLQQTVGFDSAAYASTLNNEMTASGIIDLLDPKVRQSMRMRKLSVNTQLLKTGIRHPDSPLKNSMILDRQKEVNQDKKQEIRNAFDIVMSQSMINVVNQPIEKETINQISHQQTKSLHNMNEFPEQEKPGEISSADASDRRSNPSACQITEPIKTVTVQPESNSINIQIHFGEERTSRRSLGHIQNINAGSQIKIQATTSPLFQELRNGRNPWRHKVIQHHYPNPFLQSNVASTPILTCPDLGARERHNEPHQIFKKTAQKPVLITSGSYQQLPKSGMLIQIPTHSVQVQTGPRKPSTCQGDRRSTMVNR